VTEFARCARCKDWETGYVVYEKHEHSPEFLRLLVRVERAEEALRRIVHDGCSSVGCQHFPDDCSWRIARAELEAREKTT